MNITIVCVGSVKEKFYREALAEYSKRLSRYCKLKIIEVNDEKTKENLTENEKSIILHNEGSRILKHIRENDYVISLEILGEKLDSVQFSKKIEKLGLEGKSNITFVIGGSLGLAPEISNRADYKISFSDMTFPHQLMRVILLEQVYRSYRIMKNEPYHK
ncbi:MAG: 23S rRNA (pseudouridine(1915)-N(3))-methyltransferase RlmH [Lachnospiraceae bacterium]|nr:23S rRNA (pseudouridine(1915)-N(3))-methyltransferase RlmH [Lachnospiraceae bacterium]